MKRALRYIPALPLLIAVMMASQIFSVAHDPSHGSPHDLGVSADCVSCVAAKTFDGADAPTSIPAIPVNFRRLSIRTVYSEPELTRARLRPPGRAPPNT